MDSKSLRRRSLSIGVWSKKEETCSDIRGTNNSSRLSVTQDFVASITGAKPSHSLVSYRFLISILFALVSHLLHNFKDTRLRSCTLRKGSIFSSMREGVTSLVVEWSSVEVPDLTVDRLNLVLYIHLRTFEYSSNILDSCGRTRWSTPEPLRTLGRDICLFIMKR